MGGRPMIHGVFADVWATMSRGAKAISILSTDKAFDCAVVVHDLENRLAAMDASRQNGHDWPDAEIVSWLRMVLEVRKLRESDIVPEGRE